MLAVIVTGALTTRFFSLANARAILASTAWVGITAIGATVVMIAGSVVSLAVSQTATVVAMIFLATQQFGLPAAIVLALASGVAITALQGAVIGFWTANPIVLTIAAGFAIGGVATWISGGTTVYPQGHRVQRAQRHASRPAAGCLRSARGHRRCPVVPAPHYGRPGTCT